MNEQPLRFDIRKAQVISEEMAKMEPLKKELLVQWCE